VPGVALEQRTPQVPDTGVDNPLGSIRFKARRRTPPVRAEQPAESGCLSPGVPCIPDLDRGGEVAQCALDVSAELVEVIASQFRERHAGW
jgi:hypothetical protein